MAGKFQRKRFLMATDGMDLGEAHRQTSLADALSELGHEVIFLGKGRYDHFYTKKGYKQVFIDYDDVWMTEEKHRMMEDLDKQGFDFITPDELSVFVQQETELLNQLKLDAVITGYRPTMSISTKVAKVPLVWLIGATMAELYFEKKLATMFFGIKHKVPPLRRLPPKVADTFFLYIATHIPRMISSWNKVMKKQGLKKFTRTYKLVHGDFNLITDVPELFPEYGELPPYYSFCGPFLMDTPIEMPTSIKNYKRRPGRPLILFTMGSSGDPELFKKVIEGFNNQPFDVIVATASIINREDILHIPENVIVEKMVPLGEVLPLVDAAVIHGGQGTVYSTIIYGTPFVGIPMFGDQQYILESVARKGCGIVLSKYNLKPEMIIKSINEILSNPDYKTQMVKIQTITNNYLKNIHPPKLAAEKIINFLESSAPSYFEVKGW